MATPTLFQMHFKCTFSSFKVTRGVLHIKWHYHVYVGKKWRAIGICCDREYKLVDFQTYKILEKTLQFLKKKKFSSAYFCASSHHKFLAENSSGKVVPHRYNYARQKELPGPVPNLEGLCSPEVRPVAGAAPAQHCQAAPAWRILGSVRAQLFGGRQTRSGVNGKENTGGERQWWSSKRAPGTGDSAWEPPLPSSSAPSQCHGPRWGAGTGTKRRKQSPH